MTSSNNIFDAIPNDISDEIFETLLDSNDVRIDKIISMGHSSPDSGWYDQDKNEWVVVLKGEALLTFSDGAKANLKAGDYINIMAHHQHKVVWTDPDTETVWLAVHY